MMGAVLLRMVLLAGLMLATSAFAQPAPPAPPTAPPDDGTSTVVAELEVIARPPGPAMWRVKKNGSEVVILGAISPLAHQQVWDHVRVEHALAGARELLVTPPPQVKIWELPGLLFKLNGLKSGTPLETRLSAPLRARFLNATRIAGQPAKRYQGDKPAAAGFRLLYDYRKAAGLSDAKPTSTVERLAKAARVPIRPLAQVRAIPMFDAFLRMSDAQQLVCLDAALADVEDEAAHAKPAGEAWARGDIAAARAYSASPALDRCALQLPTISAMLERGTTDATKSVEAALAQPGRSVAVIDLRFLTRANGILDRLKAQGAEISVPME